MSAKILVADDSKTIQKVVGITLADTDYTVDQSLNEAELHQKLNTESYSLVLLDYNLSDTKSGYELVSEVKGISPNASVMLMLGTFDTLDEERSREVGVDDEVVKPFESAKFIQKCKNLVERSESSQVAAPEKSEPVQSEDSDENFSLVQGGEEQEEVESTIGDGWVVDAPEVKEKGVTSEMNPKQPPESPLESNQDNHSSNLHAEVEDWGMEVPNVIGEASKDQGEYPPIIEEQAEKTGASTSNESDGMDEMDDFPSSNVEDLQGQESSVFNLEQPSWSNDIEFELKEEVEKEITPEEFWATDEGDSSGGSTPNTGDFTVTQEASASTSNEEMIQEIVNRITPMIEKRLEEKIQNMIEKSSADHIEKVAWEVIPDLAENLIRKEIKDISDSL